MMELAYTELYGSHTKFYLTSGEWCTCYGLDLVGGFCGGGREMKLLGETSGDEVPRGAGVEENGTWQGSGIS